MARTNKILIIVTNVDEYENVGYRTGLWLGELTHFYDVAEEAGFTMDIASPAGGKVPIDAESLAHSVLEQDGTGERYRDRAFMNLLGDTMAVADAHLEDYDAIYLTGGHGVSFDFPNSRALADLIARFHESGRVVSAVCHGPAGLLEVKTSDSEYMIKGEKLTAFSWKEEEMADRDFAVPFNLEDELKKRSRLREGRAPLSEHVCVDGLLITGQNPAGARPVAKVVVERLAG